MRESATAYDGCFHVCQHAHGLGASDCITECRAYTDVAQDKTEALKEFVADNSYNEAGGERMEKAYEEEHPGEKVPDCQPTFHRTPQFNDVDLNHDGVITPEEAEEFGQKMCVSNEMVMQIFDMTDRNLDKKVDPKEFDQVGEDTKAEGALDKVVDPLSEGDDEYAPVKLPQFEEFDKNKDNILDQNEMEDVLMFELHRRFPGVSDDELVTKAADVMDELAAEVHRIDQDGDGMISRKEFHMVHLKKDQQTLGHEFKEAATGDHNAQELDDEKTVEHPTMVPPPPDNLPAAVVPGPAPAPTPAAAAAALFRHRAGRPWWAGGAARKVQRPHLRHRHRETVHLVAPNRQARRSRNHHVHAASKPLPEWMRNVIARKRQQRHKRLHGFASLAALSRPRRAHRWFHDA